MADTKISALTAASAAAGANEIPINEAGTSKKLTVTQLETYILDSPTFAAGSATANSKPKLSSGTILTTPEAGALEYDGTNFYATPDTTNGRALDCLQNYFRLTANGSTITTIAPFFGANSAIPTVTNGVYELWFYMNFTKTTASTVTWTLTNTQTYTNLNAHYYQSIIGGIASVAAMSSAGITAATTAAAALPVTGSLATAVNHHFIIRAFAECGTAGNIRLNCTSTSGSVTPQRGSYFTVRRLPAANVGTFVA